MLLSSGSTLDSYLQFITVLLLFIFVLAITYVTTRWIARYEKGKAVGNNMEVMETLRINSNKFLQIVRVGKKYIVISVGKDEIHMLCECTEEELIWKETQGTELNFNSILEKFKKQNEKDND